MTGRENDRATVERHQGDAGSAFTPPLGVPLPPLPDSEGSAFQPPSRGSGATTGTHPLPSRAGRPGAGQANGTHGSGSTTGTHPRPGDSGSTTGTHPFTPPDGIPVVRLPGDAPWQDRMRAMLRMPVAERPALEPVPRPESGAAAVPRVLDLTLRIGELLLAGGEGAEDVEASMFGVARAYGLDRVEPGVTFTLLSISHQPSLVEDPVTASRTVRRRGSDYTRLAAVYRLIDDITAHEATLEDAYRRLAEIRRNRHPYPGWLLTGAAGFLAGSGAVLVGGGPLVFVAAALGAILGDRLAWLCAGRGLPEFYQFVAAATPAAVMGILLNLLGSHVPGSGHVQASAVITGGLYALLPGRALVAAVQDGLTGFYITASARLLEVMYLIVGIVFGVTLVLYAGVSLHVTLNPDEALGAYDKPPVQLVAAMGLTLAFAVLLQCDRAVLPVVTLNGGIAWVVYALLHYQVGMSPIAATAIAAGLVGLFGHMLARYQHASALPYVTAAIGPLLPGSATYFGLLAFTQGRQDVGVASLAKAVALALAVAVGVNLGGELIRMMIRLPADRPRRRAAKRTRGF
ncbi:threonine/serine ThrE exporter family protein [Streptantibioticus silvisoli]|uniref:Threonine/serine exporter family protein n=1 Tax=Streptantibioticus silvisoli TaxID=2705255 RepID=A0ABT6VWN0_9ACTN|nr:threonine/serine exporter family protein [Streptantibioticus silvisoli]MDI5962893.1 threonine/serine exporter family protein [Streptantibioticus silvisoli]